MIERFLEVQPSHYPFHCYKVLIYYFIFSFYFYSALLHLPDWFLFIVCVSLWTFTVIVYALHPHFIPFFTKPSSVTLVSNDLTWLIDPQTVLTKYGCLFAVNFDGKL